MPFITSTSILQTKDAANNIVVAVNRALRFQGASVTQDGPAQTLIDVTSVLASAWKTDGNSLTGPTPDTPVELLGSINDYDVVMKRNSSEILRLISDGLLVKTKNILDLTIDPTDPPGVPAEIGSIGMWDNSGVGRVFIKTGAADFAWAEVDYDSNDWSLFTNALSGISPSTPDQSFGSSNDFDLILKRNSAEYLRLNSTGLVFNVDTYFYDYALKAFRFGEQTTGGTIYADYCAFAFGVTQNNSQLKADDVASFAFGGAYLGSSISANVVGSEARGETSGLNAEISTGGVGALAQGQAAAPGTYIRSSGSGSIAFGQAGLDNSYIHADQEGAVAGGHIFVSDAHIKSSGRGSMAIGNILGANSYIEANEDGGFSFGSIEGPISYINAAAKGSHAHGYIAVAGEASYISATGEGSTAFGYTIFTEAYILASGNGSLAFGYADETGIASRGIGSFAGGYAAIGDIQTSGNASFVFGDAINTNSSLSQTFGLGHRDTSYLQATFGRYATDPVTSWFTWVPTEPLFVLGNGTSSLAKNNAYVIDKDGKQTTTASHVNKAIRIVVGADSISARTDRTVVFDTTGAGGNLQLPAGENGLEFIFSPKGVGASTYVLITAGLDTFDTAVSTILSSGQVQSIQYFAGTWYSTSN